MKNEKNELIKYRKYYIDGYTDDQLDKFIYAYSVSGSYKLACSSTGISEWMWKKWEAIATMVEHEKMLDDRKKDKVDIKEVTILSAEVLEYGKRYRKNKKFREECEMIARFVQAVKSQYTMGGLKVFTTIQNAGVNDSRTEDTKLRGAIYLMESVYGRLLEKDPEIINPEEEKKIAPITVTYIDPNSEENRSRLERMEQEIAEQFGGVPKA